MFKHRDLQMFDLKLIKDGQFTRMKLCVMVERYNFKRVKI